MKLLNVILKDTICLTFFYNKKKLDRICPHCKKGKLYKIKLNPITVICCENPTCDYINILPILTKK